MSKAIIRIFHSRVFSGAHLVELRQKFDSIAEVHYHAELIESPAHLKDIARDADIIIANDIALKYNDLKDLPNLKMISLLGTGYDMLNLADMQRGGIAVCNAPTYGTENVAQHTIAMIFALAHRIGDQNQKLADQGWQTARPSCIESFPIIELQGKTLGLVGYGHIARRVKEMLVGFGMKVIASTSKDRDLLKREGVEKVSLAELCQQADIISLHTRSCPENNKMINAELLASMKESALLINTARGDLIDEDALIEALENKSIAGAGLDVLATEPPSDQHRLLKENNCLLTPHIAWNSNEARERLAYISFDNAVAFLAGKKLNRVV